MPSPDLRSYNQKCGITRTSVRNAKSQVLLQTHWMRDCILNDAQVISIHIKVWEAQLQCWVILSI